MLAVLLVLTAPASLYAGKGITSEHSQLLAFN
jgi:hypothetical protein